MLTRITNRLNTRFIGTLKFMLANNLLNNSKKKDALYDHATMKLKA
jgi:hypothetical protein